MKPNAIFIHSGEFGYELLSFQGILRKVRNQYNVLGVCTFPGRDALYYDFADFVIPYPKEILERINPPTNKEQGFPAFNEVKSFLKTVLPNYDSFNFQLISPHLGNFYYPLDERLDLTGVDGVYTKIKTSGYIQNLIGRVVQDKQYIVCVPRYALTHPQRTWPIQNWFPFTDHLTTMTSDLYFVFFLFSTSPTIEKMCYHTQDEGFNSNRVIMVNNPTIEVQVEFINHSVGVIYNHSGAAFLPLFCSAPFFSFGISDDMNHIYNRPNSIYNLLLLDKWCTADEGMDLRNLKVSTLLLDFIHAQIYFHQRRAC